MDKIKLLVVDDSILFREILSKFLLLDGMIEVVEKAGDAYSARDAILKYEPDIMTLDLEMPRMDGTNFLKKLLPQYYIPVIAVSSSADRKADCLAAGAVDFLAKPQTRNTADMEAFAEELCQAIRKAYKTIHPNAVLEPSGTPRVSETQPTKTVSAAQNFSQRVGSIAENAAKFAAQAQKTVSNRTKNLPTITGTVQLPEAPKNSYISAAQAHPKLRKSETLIALGASTGGTEALEQVIRVFPQDTPPVVIVQHMPAGFTKLYAERLNRSCKMQVKEAEDGDRLRHGLIIIGAGDYQLRVQKDAKGWYVSSKPGERVSGHCPSVDVLFNSVASAAGPKAIGAILTGMGRDGADGLLAMRQAGAFTIGQDRESCVVYGMPMEAYKIGAVQVQAPLNKIADIILGAYI